MKALGEHLLNERQFIEELRSIQSVARLLKTELGEAFLLTAGAYAVELLCSQPLKVLIRNTFPL